MSWPITNILELMEGAVTVLSGEEMLYQTLLVAGSFVVHVTCAVLVAILVAVMLESTGAVESGVVVPVPPPPPLFAHDPSVSPWAR